MQKKQHYPKRMCVGCREMKQKEDLLKLVKVKNKDEKGFSVLFDENGKINGRGAYICKNEKCLQRAKKIRGFERIFSCKIEDLLYNKLEEALSSNE
mgnify:FL=1